MRLYLDANPVVYFVEQVHPHYPRVVARVLAPGVDVVISDLTRMECLVKPLKSGNAALLSRFATYFGLVEVVEMAAAVFDKAADVRARFPKIRRLMHSTWRRPSPPAATPS